MILTIKQIRLFAEKFCRIKMHQRWAESKKLTPIPVSKTKTPVPSPNPVSLRILDSRSGPCPSLMLLVHPTHTSAS